MPVITNSQLVQLANKLIPKHKGVISEVYPNGNTNDIVNTILAIDKNNKAGTSKFAKWLNNSASLEKTLKNVYWFVKRNITYKIDGYTQQVIKLPQAIWHLREGDCKSYAIFISSLLKNLNIPHQYKFAGYNTGSNNVTHIYIVVPQNNGQYIVLDPCMPDYNKEKNYVNSIIKNPSL